MGEIDDLTFEQAYELINSKRFYNGTPVSGMSDDDLINCRKYAVDHYYDKWYWVHFYHLVNDEIRRRNPDQDLKAESKYRTYWDDPRVLDVDPLYH